MAVMKFAVGLAAGYVLGTRAGREKYEQILATARKLSSGSGSSAGSDTPTATVTAQPLVAGPSDTAGSAYSTADTTGSAGNSVPRAPRRRTRSTVTTPAVTTDPLA